MSEERNYPEDIQIGDILFKGYVIGISVEFPLDSALGIFSFLLHDRRKIELLSDQDITHLNIKTP
jgi:hypothetical protein